MQIYSQNLGGGGSSLPAQGGVQGLDPLLTNGSTTFWANPQNHSHLFDEFGSGLPNVNLNVGNLGWRAASVGGAVLAFANAGNLPATELARPGIMSLQLGTTTNNTGTCFLTLDSYETYVGQGALTLQGAIKTPSVLSSSTIGYKLEFGFGASFTNGGTAQNNCCLFCYDFTVSPQFFAATANNGTVTQVTTVSSTFTVAINTWYNWMVQAPGAGGTVGFYMSNAGGTYALLGYSSTNLPDINDFGNPIFSIYKGSSHSTSRAMLVDWWQADMIFNSAR